jgi:hypothetical protein
MNERWEPSRKSIDTPQFTSIKSHAASGFYGVVAIRKRWQAKITYSDNQHYIGT